MQLYPLKFQPILKEKIWGGDKLQTYGKEVRKGEKIGESWELSAQGDDISVVTNGFLKDNDLNELVEIYMGELVGERVYQRYGNLFPLLFKFIDAEDNLSVQVHPGDEVALERHGSLGKTELWYVVEAEADSQLILGFQEDTDAENLQDKLAHGGMMEMLNQIPISKGQVAYLPAGTVHSLGKGVMVAEIQETSDVTYRLYDYDRRDAQGNPRDLHIAEALDVLDFTARREPLLTYEAEVNKVTNLAQDVFTVNLLHFSHPIGRDYTPLDSFVVYMCVEGSCVLKTADTETPLQMGETVLIPASIGEVSVYPQSSEVKLLEAYV